MELTKRQIEIVNHLADGKTAEEIAEALCRSVQTVRTQVKQACRRVGAKNAVNLVAQSISRGWIAPLVLALLISDIHHQAYRVRQPTRTRETISMVRIARRVEAGMAA